MKRIIAGAVGTLAALFFLVRIRYAAGSFLKTAEAVGDRTYTTAEELTALFLIFCIVLLLTGFMLSLMQAAKALTGAPRKAALPAETGLLFLWYVYACLYGYPLLDNHFTTAWFMTGKYTAQLIESIMNLFAGVAGMSFSWNDSIAWHAVCAALLVCPFVLMSVFLGIRNFVPVFLSAAGFAFAWAAGHYFLLGGKEQLILGAAASVLAAAAADRFSDESALGSVPKQKRKEPLFRLKVGSRGRKALAAGCIALWIFTIWAGRIRSFTAVMRLIFSSDVYKYQSNVFELADVRIAQALLVSYVPTRVVLADLAGLRNLMIIFSIISILVLCVLIERVTHVVIRPVKEMTRVITSMASGDFTVSMKVKGNDEIAVMGRSVEHFIASMKEMIRQMGHVSDRLEKQAGSSKNVSGEMNSAANIQSQSMTELNATVDQLSVSVNEIAQNATQLAGVVADTKEDSDKVEDKMRTTVEVSEKGKADMESVGNALHNIEISIHNLEEAVNKVGTASGEIVDIIKLIGDIAEETNLLSLNASIEAARAGEAGRGFAVVASQIGVLAKNSADSVAHITSLINEINGLVDDAVKQVGNSASDIESSADLIHTAVDTFDQIFQNIQRSLHGKRARVVSIVKDQNPVPLRHLLTVTVPALESTS